MTNKANRKLASCPNSVDRLRVRLMCLALDTRLTRDRLTNMVAITRQHGLASIGNIAQLRDWQLRNEIFRIAATEFQATGQQLNRLVAAGE